MPQYSWIPLDSFEFSLIDDDGNEIIISPFAEGKFTAEIYYKNNGHTSVTRTPKKLKQCVKDCERFAKKNLNVAFEKLQSRWMRNARHQKPSPAQLRVLKENNFFKNPVTKFEAFIEIKKRIAHKNKKQRLQNFPRQRFFLEEKIDLELLL